MQKRWWIAVPFILALFLMSGLSLAVGNVTTNHPQVLQQNPNLTLVAAKINITKPNEGEKIDRRWTNTCTIKWDYSGFKNGKSLDGTLVKIDLYRNSVFFRNIADNYSIGTDGSGSYPWSLINPVEIPYNIPNDYWQIQIQSKSYYDVKDMSGKFIVVNIPT